MDRLSISLGKPFGIPLVLHWTFCLFALFLLLTDPKFGLLYLAVIASVILHEFGHCAMAKLVNIQPKGITILPIGGAAQIHVPYDDPRREFLITIGGPPVNAFLSVLFAVFSAIFASYGYGAVAEWCKTFSMIQFILVVFNALPVYPMDGGRILRVFLVLLTRNPLTGMKIAVRLGQFVSLAVGLFFLSHGALWIPMIMLLMGLASEADYRTTLKKDAEKDKTPTNFDDIFKIMVEDAPLKERAAKLDTVIEKLGQHPFRAQLVEISQVMKQAAALEESQT